MGRARPDSPLPTPTRDRCVADVEVRDDFTPLKATMLSQFADLVLKDVEQSKVSLPWRQMSAWWRCGWPTDWVGVHSRTRASAEMVSTWVCR